MTFVKISGIKLVRANGATYRYHRATGKRISANPKTQPEVFFAEVKLLEAEALAYYGGLRKEDVVRVPKVARVGGSIDMDIINKNGKELSIFEAKRLPVILNEPDQIQMG